MSGPGPEDAEEDQGPVALMIQRRIADDGHAAYRQWLQKVAGVLADWPGFLGQDVVAPSPPVQVDWVAVQRFAGVASARAWLHSEQRTQLLAEVQAHFVGTEDVHLLTEGNRRSHHAASVVITCKVAPEDEAAFLAWQRRIARAEADFKGFRGHKLEHPVPGVHDTWVVILSFDTEANLERWINSAQRTRLLAEGHRFHTGLRLRKASYGFDFWFQPGSQDDKPAIPVMRSNLLVLLVLYPIVFLWGYFISAPWIDSRGVPFWLSLFIGNLVSTQLLGWLVVPAVFRAFGWWLGAAGSTRRTLAGYALVIMLYAVSMGCYAWLLGWTSR